MFPLDVMVLLALSTGGLHDGRTEAALPLATPLGTVGFNLDIGFSCTGLVTRKTRNILPDANNDTQILALYYTILYAIW